MFKSFRLDVAERQLLDNGVRVPLAPRAFEVLVTLVENSGHLVEKDELLRTVWHGSFVEEANIARVIHMLRKALRENETGDSKFIETVAKRGYRFVADVRRIDLATAQPPFGESVHVVDEPRAARPANAFQAYQLARYHFNQMTPPDLLKSRALLHEALRFDGGYAPAYAALAEQAVQEVVTGLRQPSDAYPEARSSLVRARDLDPDSVEFYTSAGFVSLLAEWDFASAEHNLRIALDINPHHAFANSCLGQVFMFQGRSNEAQRYLQTAAALDPMNLALQNLLPISLFLSRRYRETIEQCEKMLALYPGFLIAEWIRCWALEQTGRADEATQRYEAILLYEPHGELVRRWMGYAYATAGARDKALDTVARLDAESGAHYLSATHQAMVYAGLNDSENAIRYLATGCEERDPWMLWIATDPRYDNLRAIPRFAEFVDTVTGLKAAPLKTDTKSDNGESPAGFRLSPSGAHAIVDLADWNDRRDEPAKARQTAPPSGFDSTAPPSRWKPTYFSVAAMIALLAIGGVGTWQISSRRTPLQFPIVTNAFHAERLSTDGRVFNGVISPNGKLVIYSHNNLDHTASVWLRNLETGHNREVVPASRDIYFGLDFSPDGDWLYFVRRQRGEGTVTGVYRLSIHGGLPEKILLDTQGWISISPDGSQVAFVRCHYQPDDNCSLFVANTSDGGNERKLVTRPRPYRIRDVDFSPDGKLIAFAAGQSENEGMDFSLWAYDLDAGTERVMTPEKFFNITSVEWLPDSTSVLLAASRRPLQLSKIWSLAVDSGRVEILSKDAESYRTISLDRSGTKLVATRYEEDFRIRVLSWDRPGEILVLPKAGLMRFAADGKLLYTSDTSGTNDIWSINLAGTGRTQLTNDLADETRPVPSHDAATIYFSSNRTGSAHVWSMNVYGSDQTQVTLQTGGFPLGVSPDGAWVFYHHETNRSLWRVRTRGGDEQEVLKTQNGSFSISPDGRSVAYPDKISGESYVTIVSLLDGEVSERLKVADQGGRLTQLAWLPDGRGIAYLIATNEFNNSTLWRHKFDAVGGPQRITDFDQQINEGGGLAISPDGKSYAVSQGGWPHDAVLITGLK